MGRHRSGNSDFAAGTYPLPVPASPASVAALGNFYTIFGDKNVAAQTTPTLVQVAAVLITPTTSGIFRVDADVGWSSDTDADPVVWTLNWRQVNVAGQTWTVGGSAAAAGFKGANASQASGFVATSNGTITLAQFGGGGSALVALDQKQIDSVTGLLAHSDQYYGVHGLVRATTGAPFAIGRQVAFTLGVNAQHTITIPSLTLSVQEMPQA